MIYNLVSRTFKITLGHHKTYIEYLDHGGLEIKNFILKFKLFLPMVISKAPEFKV